MLVGTEITSGRRIGEQLPAMRYKSKQALLDDIRTEHDLLCARLEGIPKARWYELEVWGDGWTLSDLVAHFAEWQLMFLCWYKDGLRGTTPQLPAPGYRWSETPSYQGNQALAEGHGGDGHVRRAAQQALAADGAPPTEAPRLKRSVHACAGRHRTVRVRA